MVQASIFCLLGNPEWVSRWLCPFLVVDLMERVAGNTQKDCLCWYLALLETYLGTLHYPSIWCRLGIPLGLSRDDGADSPTCRHAHSMLMPWYL